MIRHTVAFKLKSKMTTTEKGVFFTEIKKLVAIPGVQKFEPLKQISKKNNFEYGLSMEFTDVEAYNNYSNHPQHNAFVQNYWLKYVEDFMELDYEPRV